MPPIQISPRAVVEPKWSQPLFIPRSVRNPFSQAAFCASVRTTKPGGSSGAIIGRSTHPNRYCDGRRSLLQRSNPFSSQFYGGDCLASASPRRRVVVGMSQPVAQVLNRTEFAFRSGPAALDQPRLDEDLSLVRELRRHDAVDLQAASFPSLLLLLDTLTPISEQDQPVERQTSRHPVSHAR